MNNPLGQRFSHVYLERGAALTDSNKVRNRVRGLVERMYDNDVRDLIFNEIGLNFFSGADFFNEAEISDVLDFVTVVFREIRKGPQIAYKGRPTPINAFRSEVERIFREENSSYAIDEQGGVHLYVDAEFVHSNTITIKSLEHPRYANAADAFRRGIKQLRGDSPSGKNALRNVFLACEGLFKVIFPKSSTLAKDEIQKDLLRTVQSLYGDDQSARVAGQLMLKSFGEWIAAAHQYRHEPGTEDVSELPLPIAVLMISQGAAYIRWLVDIDQEVRSAVGSVSGRA